MLMNKTILVDSVRCWLLEDIGKFDLTTELIVAPGTQGRFNFVSREKIVMAGLDVINTVFEVLSTNLKFKQFCKDSDSISPGFKIACVSGNASQILEGERLALNLLQRMCGIATTTSEYVAKIAHTHARLIDTRKTTPGLRLLEKYAFFCGGGHNHRYSLDAGVIFPEKFLNFNLFKLSLPDFFGVSRVEFKPIDSIEIINLQNEPRCERSWKRDITVKDHGDGLWLSYRDAAAVKKYLEV